MSERPKYQLLPDLAEDEYAALREDIRAAGVRVPIDVDETGEILDGHHRKRAADEIGIECPVRVVRGLEEFAKVDYALTVNLARRHLNHDQKRELVKTSLLRSPRLSDREHARRCGVSHPFVAGMRETLVSAGKLDAGPRVDSRGRVNTQRPDVESDSTSSTQSNSPAGQPQEPDAPEGSDQVATDGQPEDEPSVERLASLTAPDVPPLPEDKGSGTPEEGSPGRAPSSGAIVNGPAGPMSKDFADALDRHVPDPDPNGPWRVAFLGAIQRGRSPMRFTPEEVAEKADDGCLNELAKLADNLTDYVKRVETARGEYLKTNLPDNVRQIRSAS